MDNLIRIELAKNCLRNIKIMASQAANKKDLFILKRIKASLQLIKMRQHELFENEALVTVQQLIDREDAQENLPEDIIAFTSELIETRKVS